MRAGAIRILVFTLHHAKASALYIALRPGSCNYASSISLNT